MNISPLIVVERELVRIGRRWQTFVARVGFAAAVFLLVGFVYVGQYAVDDILSVTVLAQIGRGLFLTWTTTLFLAVVLITPILVGQAVIDEKEEHTLELLAITMLTPRRILVGTLFSRLVMMESLILAVVPVLALVLGFGGVGPLEMLNAIVQANVVMLVTGTVATFVALYSRSVIMVAFRTWSVLFVSQVSVGMLVGLVALAGGIDMIAITPLAGLAGMSGMHGASLWIALVGPVLVWGSVSFTVMHVTGLCFNTLALSEKQATEKDADLSFSFWDFDRFRRRIWPAVFLLVLLSPVLLVSKVTPHYARALPAIIAGVWATAALSVLMVQHLLWIRKSSLKSALASQKRVGRRSSWRRVNRYFEERARAQSTEPQLIEGAGPVMKALRGSRSRSGKLLSPFQREVWSWPVVWRESVTSAHGRLRRVLAVWYIWLVAFLVIFALAGGIDALQMFSGVGAFQLLWLPFLTLLLATSSIVGERTSGTLELLGVTPISGRRLVLSKLLALALLLGPGYLLGGSMYIFGLGASQSLESVITGVIGLMWFLVINTVIALLCIWCALEVKTPSRAWPANLVLVITTTWALGFMTAVLGGLSFAASILEPVMNLWAVVVPMGILSFDADRFPLYLLVSSGFWTVVSLGLARGAAQAMRRRVSTS